MSVSTEDIAIDSVGAAELARLIAVGEPGGVEFKASVPKKDGLAPSVAAFANSGGGWLLLGVRDDGSVCGFSAPGAANLHDWLRDSLQSRIDPLPLFRTRIVATGEGEVAVVRIPASVSTPHVLCGTGVVLERVTGGKRPIDSQAKLIAMCEAPEDTEERVVQRLTGPRLVHEALVARMDGPVANGQTRVAEWYVAATPLQVPAGFADAVLSRTGIRAIEQYFPQELARLAGGKPDLVSQLTPRSRGYVVAGSSLVTGDEAALTVDAGGTAVARWSTRLFRGDYHLPSLGDDVLLPLLRLAVAPLLISHADGPVRLHAYLKIVPMDGEYAPLLTVSAADQSGRLEAPQTAPQFLGGRLSSPTPDELQRQTDAWWRELGRAAGLGLWEG
jgi:hypothetical protein